MCPFPLANSGVFCDAWTLERIEQPTPHTYHRAVHLLPQDATDDEIAQVIEEAIPKKQTITWSVDDAFLTHPNLTQRNVTLWNVKRLGGARDLAAWVKEHYPPWPGPGHVTYRRFDPIEGPEPTPEPDPQPEPFPQPFDPTAPLLSLHVQTDVKGLPGFIAAAQPAWVKLVGNAELAHTIKLISPDTRVLYRHHVDHQDPYLQHSHPPTAARMFLDCFWDAVEANPIDAVEGLNETIATGDVDGIKRAVAFEVALSDEVARRGAVSAPSSAPIAACLLNTAIGNPGHGPETELLLPAAEAAVRNGHYIGYHPYFPAYLSRTAEWLHTEARHHHLRALISWDPIFTAAGYHVHYLFTEAGACGARPRPDGRPGAYNPNAGWRDSWTLNGNWHKYRDFLSQLQQQVVTWNLQNHNRARAILIFTVGQPYVGWDGFKLWERELETLAEALT